MQESYSTGMQGSHWDARKLQYFDASQLLVYKEATASDAGRLLMQDSCWDARQLLGGKIATGRQGTLATGRQES